MNGHSILNSLQIAFNRLFTAKNGDLERKFYNLNNKSSGYEIITSRLEKQ